MKIALAQINPIVGNLRGNGQKIINYAQQARSQGADLVVFPEMSVVGYPPQDLLENTLFIEEVQQAVAWIAAAVPGNLGLILGAPVPNPAPTGKRLFNAALLYEGGQRLGEVHKTLLPTYDVFDEGRHFAAASAWSVVKWRGLKLGLHICEDMWNSAAQAEYHLYEQNPIDRLASQGADLLINISASPFSRGRHQERTALIREICQQHPLPFLLVNQVGGNTELIFDGDSRVHGADGQMVRCGASFREDLLLWEMEAIHQPCRVERDDIADIHDAIALGLHDYFHKTGGFNKVVLGLSGGIDSAVTCALAVAALGAERVVGVTMPSAYSSSGSVEDSQALAENLGIEFHRIPIKPAIAAFDQMLEDVFADTEPGVAEENLQARSRGIVLMALSNKFDYLLLSSGNKSEVAVGYVTLYGDTNGGLAVLSDVFKTCVYELAQHINRRAGRTLIPENTITKPPSAELKPGQQDSDSLPPYEILDAILQRYISGQQDLEQIVAAVGCDRDLVLKILRQVDRNEYKRRQAPPGLRVTSKAFGIGRQMPIVMRWDRKIRRLNAPGSRLD